MINGSLFLMQRLQKILVGCMIPHEPLFLSTKLLYMSLLQVKFEKGVQVVKVFKEHSSQTCILDDFEFYEAREKATQEKKSKEQQFPKQVRLMSSYHVVQLPTFDMFLQILECCVLLISSFYMQAKLSIK